MKDKTKYAYLAGLIDGEGHIGIVMDSTKHQHNPDRSIGYAALLTIANTDLAIMKWLKQEFGGNYYLHKSYNQQHRKMYTWRMRGLKQLELLLLAFLPYLRIKREQAKVLLEFVRIPEGEHCVNKRSKLHQELLQIRQVGKQETNMQNTSNKIEVKIESDLTSDCKSAPVVTLIA
jgi:hypothetical protein